MRSSLPATFRGVPLSSMGRLFAAALRPVPQPQCVFIAICDHYEPFWGGASQSLAEERVQRWVEQYPRSVEGLEDSRGRSPQHTFFYPAEDYEPHVLDELRVLCQQGHGDVEVHLHHDDDHSDALREQLETFAEKLHYRHGLLWRDAQGRIRYGFIHGNWALGNARPDGKWCGVNEEITILRETGCYADFTMPSAPAACQTRAVNSIYYATDDPLRPKSHDTGRPARVGQPAPEDALLMIQGPLLWNFARRKWQLLPRLENGDLHGTNGPSLLRLRHWLKASVCVQGRPDWLFIKLHSHGAQEVNSTLFLDGPMRQFHLQLAELARSRFQFDYYYVTAREMASLVHQAEQGLQRPELSQLSLEINP